VRRDEIITIMDRVLNKLSTGLMWVAQGALFFLMLLVAFDVIARYVFNTPITGALEIIEVLMVPVVFLSLGFCTRKGQHVIVDLMTFLLSSHAQRIIAVGASLACAATFAIIVWQTGVQALDEMLSPASSSSMMLHIPESPFLMTAVIGSLAMCLEYVVQAINGTQSHRKDNDNGYTNNGEPN